VSLRSGARAALELARRIADEPLRWMRWLRPQAELLRQNARIVLYRGGNQVIGKTTAGLAKVLFEATGTNPFTKPFGEAAEYWVICASWPQSVAIQKKLWDLVPKRLLHPDTVFTDVRGFKGKNPVVQVLHVPTGKYSTIRFKTTQQGALNLAGASIRGALFDEPPKSQAVYSEVVKRVMAAGGWVLLTLTPIGAPVDYLRAECERGVIVDIHARLTPQNVCYDGTDEPLVRPDGTVCDADYIAEIEHTTLPQDVPIRVHGEWETRVEGRVFRAFDSRVGLGHVTDQVPDADMVLCLGVDHGSKDFKQIGLLVGIDQNTGGVHVFDEYVGAGDTLPDDDAAGVLAMLGRWGWEWKDLELAHGDKPYDAGRTKGIGRKSNKELESSIAKKLRVNRERLSPRIQQAKTGAGGGRGSIDRGCTWLHRAMLREDGFKVQSRCVRLIEALERWDYTDSDFKDPIDALRYATWRQAMRGGPREARTTIYVY
jgi:phage terminase large subunit-like protein